VVPKVFLDISRGPLQVSEGVVPGPVVPGPVGIGETFPDPDEVPSPEGAGAESDEPEPQIGAGAESEIGAGAESDEPEPQIVPAPPTLEGTTTTVVTRSGRQIKRNRRFFGDQWTTYHSGNPRQKVSGAILNQQFLNSLSWNMSHDALHSMSSSWKRLANFIQDAMDSKEKTIEEWSPMALALKANAEDNPTWEQAMNGPTEMATGLLQKKNWKHSRRKMLGK